MASGPRILIVSSGLNEAQPLVAALARAGAVPLHVSGAEAALPALKSHVPQLVIVRADPDSPQLELLERGLRSDAAMAFTPLALITFATSFAPCAAQLRTGIVALWEPGAAASIVQRAFTLLAELPRRSGVAQAGLEVAERALLWKFLRETRRTGALRLGPERSGDGTALLVEGALREARCGELTGMDALKAILQDGSEPLTFREVSSFPGSGASVVLQIDRAEEDVPTIAGELLEDSPASNRRVPLLLVDDDPELCRMFSLLFKRHGFDVTVAEDGVEGFSRACEAPFELVVADLNMPRMDGWGLLRLLREDFRTRELPVAFLSCHDDYRDSLKALDAGAQAYFSKSLRLEALAGQVRAMLAPHLRLREALANGQPTAVALAEIGPQTVLRLAEAQRCTGLLEAQDDFASYQVVIVEGQPAHATAQSGRHVAQGERALTAFVASRQARGQFTPGPSLVAPSLQGSLEEQLRRATETLNANERRLRESLLVGAQDVDVNRELYEVYAQVGPKQWLETARLICEELLPPREVIARVELSPIEVEETIRDLLRRGVVTLQKTG